MGANLVLPRRGQWIALTLSDDRVLVCRFVAAGRSRYDDVHRWEVDHGAYGSSRHDSFSTAEAITSWAAAPRPPLRLSFINPHGRRCFVGRFLTHPEAQAAIDPVRGFARDIRIEAAR